MSIMVDAYDLRLVNGLTLDELLRSLEEDEFLPDGNTLDIAIMPPDNACDPCDTDEDSGNEEDVIINNLPGSQLRAPAELLQNANEEWEEEDLVPLSQFKKRISQKPVKKVYKWINGGNLYNPGLQSEFPTIATVNNNKSPIELFQHFFDYEVMNMFVTYTNQYAANKNKVSDISIDEMKAFFGILLLSGYNPLPRRRMYWENSVDTHNSAVSESLPRNRFEHILTNLHCCDNNLLDNSDKFAKVRPLFHKLNERFLAHAPIQENHCVDEAMVPYFGRHGCKQFIRGKPLRYGYKLWVGATSGGYVVWYEPYQGAKSEIADCYKSLGLGPSVVLQYIDILQLSMNLEYCVFFDNFFSTLELFDELSRRKIRAAGTIRKNRIRNSSLPTDEQMKNLRGSYAHQITEEKSLLIVKWTDNKVVNMISNFFNVTPLQQVTRYSQKEKKRISVMQPYCIKRYNQSMGGVDRSDQNIGLYRTGIRGKKWYFPLISHLLDAAEQNAWQLHRLQGGRLDHLSFRRNVALSLLRKGSSARTSISLLKRLGRPSQLENLGLRFDGIEHYIGEQEKQTRCRICHKKVSSKCLKCNVALHVRCFALYHRRE